MCPSWHIGIHNRICMGFMELLVYPGTLDNNILVYLMRGNPTQCYYYQYWFIKYLPSCRHRKGCLDFPYRITTYWYYLSCYLIMKVLLGLSSILGTIGGFGYWRSQNLMKTSTKTIVSAWWHFTNSLLSLSKDIGFCIS